VGFDVPGVQQHGLGVGMRSMRARLERFHGALQIQSEPGATLLEATLWLPAEAAAAGTASGPAPQALVSADRPAAMMPPPRHTSPSYSTADWPGVTAHCASGKSRRKPSGVAWEISAGESAGGSGSWSRRPGRARAHGRPPS
jgi:hypothetical protein